MNSPKLIKFIDALYDIHSTEWEATPSSTYTIEWLTNLLEFLFPNNNLNKKTKYLGILKKNQCDLENILHSYLDPSIYPIDRIVNAFYFSLDDTYRSLRKDATKIYENDPAATSVHEVIVSYPGFFAIAVYRIAHRLVELDVPILPRILCEYAHGKTGIDIHPNAKIGCPFFIDHGTGIVIGATSIIGNNVSIYQGVTLGALYVNKGLSQTQRHPTVEDNVIIYARTTILGGNTIIGHDSLIGGSVFLTKSVEPFSSVFNTHQLRIDVKSNSFQKHKNID